MLGVDEKYYKRQRAVAFAGFVFALCLAGKLVAIQGFGNDAYTSKARHQHVKEMPLAAKRGQILDRNGRVLATTLESQSFFVNNISDADTLRSLAVRFSKESGESEREILRRLRGKRSFVWLARQMIDGPEAEDLPEGIGRVVEMTRAYPMGAIAGQLVGYTSVDQAGIEGIERAHDRLLSGTPGEVSSRVDAKGRPIGDLGVRAYIQRRPSASCRLHKRLPIRSNGVSAVYSVFRNGRGFPDGGHTPGRTRDRLADLVCGQLFRRRIRPRG